MNATDGPTSAAARTFEQVAVGDVLPAEVLALTPTLVIATALASRDFEEVHHDRDVARAKGLPDIFLNILATNGLCQRLAVDWAGPDARVVRASVRLGLPACAGDTLHLAGRVLAVADVDGHGEVTVEVTADVAGGRHGTATIVLDLPHREPGSNGRGGTP